MYYQDKEAFVKIDGSWIKVSSVEAIRPTLSGRTRIYFTSGNSIDVGSTSGHISPDDAINRIVNARSQPGDNL